MIAASSMPIGTYANSSKIPHNAPWCEACDIPCRLTTGKEIYPYRADLAKKHVWICDGCKARVGCHPRGSNPMGTPANGHLRRARQLLHERMIDPIWKTAPDHCPNEANGTRPKNKEIFKGARSQTYRFLAAKMGLDGEDCHTGMFTLEQCRAAWRALDGVTYPEIQEWAKIQDGRA